MTQYNKRLDRSRSFGEYHPPENGTFFNQDGFDFDHEGHLVADRLTEAQKKQLAKKAPAAPKAEADSKPEGQSDGSPEDTSQPNSPANPQAGDDLNLEMWLRGEEDYPFSKVQAVVRSRFNVWKTARRDLVMFLVEEQKLVAVGDLSDEFKSLVA